MHALVSTLLGSLISAFLPMVFHRLSELDMVDAMVDGALMALLPGLAMTNAVQGTMRSDTVSGVADRISAILSAALIAGGVLMALSLFALLLGGGTA